MIKKCLLCKKEFQAYRCQKYCGNWKIKGTCAYKHHREIKNENHKLWTKKNPEKVKIKREIWNRRYRGKYKEEVKNRRLKLRFQIFQRDNFTCQYCGRKVPEAILEIDHRFPESKGGKGNINNYITSCRECNLGKGDIVLKEFIKS